jgi:hypothetical protein
MKILKKLGFDISYLALLTKDRIKPLSRWEGKFSSRQVKALRRLGLKTNTVDRKLLNGGTKPELIFSTSSRYLDLYSRKYYRTAIKKDQQTVTTEGFLFGYPGCCVRNFARNGYTHNEFMGRGQAILFHWVCPGCRVTPELLPYYQRIHTDCCSLLESRRTSATDLLKASLPAAALSLLFALAPGKTEASDPHWYCSNAVDINGNFLNKREDFLLGTRWEHNLGGLPGGPAEALRFSDIIDWLPPDSIDSDCYIEHWWAAGVESCYVCGDWINMGHFYIHNPMRGISIEIPYLGLHYMSHGSFSYDGTIHTGRVDIELLKQVLAHDYHSHYIEISNDSDRDGLRDEAEDHFGTQTGDRDSNDNRLYDGAEVAEGHTETISRLPISGADPPPTDFPYMIFVPADGIETCEMCGFNISMGLVSIINPQNGAEITFPNMALHYLAHGSYAYGLVADPSEINPVLLDSVLKKVTTAPPLGHPPFEHRLSLSNYPNPFNASTNIQFTLPQNGQVALRIYNIHGQLVRGLRDEPMAAGCHHVHWDGLNDLGERAASGVYFCRLEYGGMVKAVKMVLVK